MSGSDRDRHADRRRRAGRPVPGVPAGPARDERAGRRLAAARRRPVPRAVRRQADLRHPGAAALHRPRAGRATATADRPFGAGFHLGQQVSGVERRDDGGFSVVTDAGTRFVARTIVVAGGVGSFQPRRLKVEGLDRWRDAQVFYRGSTPRNSPGSASSSPARAKRRWPPPSPRRRRRRASVALLHRRDDFEADADSLARLAAARAAGRVEFVAGQASGLVEEAGGRLSGLVVACNDGSTRSLALDALLVLLGWSPKLGPIAEWGLALERKQVVVDTARFETSVPGIYAVGDVNVYAGQAKADRLGLPRSDARRLCDRRSHPPRAREPLLYTTTSPKLHKLLGVAPKADLHNRSAAPVRSRARIRWGCWAFRSSSARLRKSLRT